MRIKLFQWLCSSKKICYGKNQKSYLSAILDLCDGSIVSYVLGKSNNNQLVFQTFEKALKEVSDTKPLLHSDRGFQYTSKTFKRMLDKVNIKQSMSRVGRCIDNGPIEGFWGSLKNEKYYLNKYDTFEGLSRSIIEYINFYNNDRLQKRLNGLSPLEYRAKAV
jgi:putative transposase